MMGRPRKACPSDEELVVLGEDLIKWAAEKTDEKRTTFQFWYAIRHGLLLEQWKRMKDTPIFRPYYEIARAYLAQRLHAEELEKGMAHRYMRMYDQELGEMEDEQVRFKAKVSADELSSNPGLLGAHKEMLKSMRAEYES